MSFCGTNVKERFQDRRIQELYDRIEKLEQQIKEFIHPSKPVPIYDYGFKGPHYEDGQ